MKTKNKINTTNCEVCEQLERQKCSCYTPSKTFIKSKILPNRHYNFSLRKLKKNK